MKNILSWLLGYTNIVKENSPTSIGLLILRLGVGLMMALGHGWGKLSNFGDMSSKFADPIGVGSEFSLGLTVFAEFFCSLAIVLGFITRGAVIPLIITMLVAVFIIHSDDPWGKKEFGLLYLVPYLTLLFTGPGRYSLDRLLLSRQKVL